MPDAAIYARLKKAIDTVKNTRSWLEGVSLHRETSGTVYAGGAVGSCRRVEIMPAVFRGPLITSTVFACGVIYQFKGVEIQHA